MSHLCNERSLQSRLGGTRTHVTLISRLGVRVDFEFCLWQVQVFDHPAKKVILTLFSVFLRMLVETQGRFYAQIRSCQKNPSGVKASSMFSQSDRTRKWSYFLSTRYSRVTCGTSGTRMGIQISCSRPPRILWDWTVLRPSTTWLQETKPTLPSSSTQAVPAEKSQAHCPMKITVDVFTFHELCPRAAWIPVSCPQDLRWSSQLGSRKRRSTWKHTCHCVNRYRLVVH